MFFHALCLSVSARDSEMLVIDDYLVRTEFGNIALPIAN
jgi:hypothetical protein